MALVIKNLSVSAGVARDVSSISGFGRASGKGNGNPLQYSCWKSPMDRGACWVTVHGVTKSQIQLSMHAIKSNIKSVTTRQWNIQTVLKQNELSSHGVAKSQTQLSAWTTTILKTRSPYFYCPHSFAFSMIQRMLAIWSLVPLPFLKPAWITSLATPALTDRFFITSATWEAQFSYIQFTYWRTACFQVLVVMNKVHNKHAREGFCVDINLLDLTARVCLALFKKKKNCQTVFQCGCTILYSHQQWMGVPVAPHSYQHLMLSVFWMLAIFIGVQWYLIVVLICISLICRGSIWCGAYFYTIAYHLNIFFGEVSVQVLSHF